MIPTIGTPVLWITFLLVVLGLLALDLGVFHRRPHAISFREAVGWSLLWIVLSLAFAGWFTWRFGRQHGLEFLTGYVIEKALSVDNIFVFLVIFRYFAVPPRFQHRVLFWGIVGALVMRGIFIAVGAALLAAFHWIIYVFGGFLVVTGGRLLTRHQPEVHPERNPVVRLFRRFVPITRDYDGAHFFSRQGGRLAATPLLLVLVVVEATDVVFAVDSIPAIFAVTRDPFIVFTSNVLAILGLRALYFVLAGTIHHFPYLNFGLGLVLVFVGLKMVASDLVHVPIGISLGVVSALLLGSVLASVIWPPEPESSPPADP